METLNALNQDISQSHWIETEKEWEAFLGSETYQKIRPLVDVLKRPTSKLVGLLIASALIEKLITRESQKWQNPKF